MAGCLTLYESVIRNANEMQAVSTYWPNPKQLESDCRPAFWRQKPILNKFRAQSARTYPCQWQNGLLTKEQEESLPQLAGPPPPPQRSKGNVRVEGLAGEPRSGKEARKSVSWRKGKGRQPHPLRRWGESPWAPHSTRFTCVQVRTFLGRFLTQWILMSLE